MPARPGRKHTRNVAAPPADHLVRVRGAREHNLKNVSVDIPRDSLVVFSGISGSGKSSLAFGTLYAEAQRRYFESVAPYARRLIDQIGVPEVDSIEGLPPAVALQQQRGATNVRSSVGSVTTLSSLVRMLYSRAGAYPRGQAMLYAEDFSPNTVQGACPACHGLGQLFDVTERSMVPDDSLSIRERAIAAWPPAWHGQNLRDILVTLGYDVDRPWRDLPKKDRDWILFTEEQPTVPVYAGFTPQETRRALRQKMAPSYQGTFTGVRKYVRQTYATTQSATMKKRVARFMVSTACRECGGKRLKRQALAVKVQGHDISELTHLPLADLAQVLAPLARGELRQHGALDQAQTIVASRIAQDLIERIEALVQLGLGYLAMDRSTPTLSPGELQRLRLATQIRSNLFGVVYVLDEPTAGLHPRDGQALMDVLGQLKAAGNSLFVVEHDLAMMRRADWLVDVGPDAGERGGQVLYSGEPDGLRQVTASHTARYLFAQTTPQARTRRAPADWLALRGVTRNNLQGVDVDIPLGVMTAVTGLSGSGKSSLVSQALVELIAQELGTQPPEPVEDSASDPHLPDERTPTTGRITAGMAQIRRLIQVDQKPIGRTPRSNLATYCGLFDHIRKLFADTRSARAKGYGPGRFSFNMPQGRCPECEGEGMVSIELLFMPSVYAPCPRCHGARYNDETLKIKWSGKSIAQVLGMTVEEGLDFFAGQKSIHHSLSVLHRIGLGYLRLGQSATELSGGEAQRVKLATELQRPPRGGTLYVLDEPTTGLHPADVDRLMAQLNDLVEAGNSVIVVEHEMRIVAQSDWVIDVGPGAGRDGGCIVACGTPEKVSADPDSATASYLRAAL